MYGTILVAVDATEPASRAVTAARELANATGDKVCLLHVTPRQVVAGKVGGTWDTEVPEEAERILSDKSAELAAAGVPVVTEVRHALAGHVADAVVAAAIDHHAGLVVVGSRGRSTVGHLVLGSTAYQVLHLTAAPVLVVR